MKSFLELATQRASVRAFQTKPAPDDLLQKVLEAGRIAPSACNLQPWHFVVVRDPRQLESLSACYKRDWLRTAPIVIAICADQETAWTRKHDQKNYAAVDAAIAIDHMTLCATDLGLGSCWVAAFKIEVVRDVLKLPPNIEPIALLPLGWPDETPNDTPRKSLDEIVHHEKW